MRACVGAYHLKSVCLSVFVCVCVRARVQDIFYLMLIFLILIFCARACKTYIQVKFEQLSSASNKHPNI